MLPHQPDDDQSSTERLAVRARRNLLFRLRLAPEPVTRPGQLEASLERIRSVIRRKAQTA